jgi:hypothetical protein
MVQLVEALRYKAEGRRFDSRWGHWNFSMTLKKLPAAQCPWSRRLGLQKWPLRRADNLAIFNM